MRPRLPRLRFVLLALAAASLRAAEPAPDFARDVRPILANHCWNCHGPDEQSREAGLRLDERPSAVAARAGGVAAIVPGDAGSSGIVARIEAADETRMPPDSFGKPLSEEQRGTLARWIAAGAPFAGHWAFETARRPEVPAVRRDGWPRGDLDRFVLARLEAEGLAPAPEADRATWLRRASLDLTGLPPTVEEVAAFIDDDSPDAFERVADRLLASPRHAERMAMQWLDVARYADTNGYNNDEVRTLWPWRDWVIRAFAENMPYDRFVTEQLAGDQLPDATVAQRVATGFSRNHVLTTEGGVIEEEYRVEYVADRVHTAATAFLGLSFQCARCHDHKYDPFTQRDYYRFAAFFDNVPDRVVGYSQGRMAEPLLEVPSPEQTAERGRLETRRAELDALLAARPGQVDAEEAAWESSLTPADREGGDAAGLIAAFSLDEASGPAIVDDVSGAVGEIVGPVHPVAGRIGGALEFRGETHVVLGEAGAFEADRPFSLSVWVRPTSTEASTVLSRIDEADGFRGYDLILEGGRVASHVVHRWPERAFKVITDEALTLDAWHHIAVTYDGSRRAAGMRIHVDGRPWAVKATTDNPVDGTIATTKPFHIGLRNASAPFRGAIDDVRLHAVLLSDAEVEALAAGATPAGLARILAIPRGERSAAEAARLRAHFVAAVDGPSRGWREEAAAIPGRLAEIARQVPVTMVMAEMSPRRETRILLRGRYDHPGEVVEPGVPVLGGLPGDGVTDRAALARWVTAPEHPLTARVAVNRWWEMFFGTGLVETVEDFGIQGTPPTHPELLDWLASELVRGGWDVRRILRAIVLSATYRQASNASPGLLERDPRNRLLTRGPRGRLPAEMVRDNALFVGGILVERVGGPSVKPWQPPGLWEDVSVERRDSYVPDDGEGAHRRSLYTFWKRTCPPPGMTTFDAPDRETCVARRGRTNTPLQALVLLNDPTYIEAARGLAARTMRAADGDDERIVHAWRTALARTPTVEERDVVARVLARARERFEADPSAAERLLAVGGATVPDDGRTEQAAWTTVASLILNLDEAISKP